MTFRKLTGKERTRHIKQWTSSTNKNDQRGDVIVVISSLWSKITMVVCRMHEYYCLWHDYHNAERYALLHTIPHAQALLFSAYLSLWFRLRSISTDSKKRALPLVLAFLGLKFTDLGFKLKRLKSPILCSISSWRSSGFFTFCTFLKTQQIYSFTVVLLTLPCCAFRRSYARE